MRKRRVSRDAVLIYVAAFLRSSTIGLVGVVLAIYLGHIGLSPFRIGLVIAAGLAGGAAATILVGVGGDAFGRKRSLIALGVLAAIGYAAVGIASNVLFIITAAFFGMLNGMGRDRGAASALDQAVLPATAAPEHRTWVLAWYNVVLDVGHAMGALAGATPVLLTRTTHLNVTLM